MATDPHRTVSEGSRITDASGSATLNEEPKPDAVSTSGVDWSEKSRIWIPSDHFQRQRTLVLCFDGTGDHFDNDNSNVVQFVAMLKKDDTSKQLVYYQTGIGTYTDSKGLLMSKVSKILDQMFAWNLADHIQAGYSFLMENYTQGDKICIFGFSRGAYTARALAGMLQKIGLLPPHNSQQIPFAWNMYKREDEEGHHLSQSFKRTFCRDVSVDFLGVWDTVASVGLIPQYLPFVTENTGIKYLRHALALDERRIKFLPSFCVDSRVKAARAELVDTRGTASHRKLHEDLLNQSIGQHTDVEEVWFAGVHTDVGGGSVKNNVLHALARVPLRWMIRECIKHTDIIFDAVMLQQLGMGIYLNEHNIPILGERPPRIRPTAQQSAKGLVSTSQSDTKRHTLPVLDYGAKYALVPFSAAEAAQHEANAEMDDALSELNDMLEVKRMWHILEWIPVRVKKQKAIVNKNNTRSGYKWVINRGRGRKIFRDELEEGVMVHRSVRTRLEAGEIFDGKRYWPKVRPNLKQTERDLPQEVLGTKKITARRKAVRLTHQEWDVDEPRHWTWVN